MVLPDPARSWVCLIGVSTYSRDDTLDALPAVPNNLDALHDIFTDPRLAGIPEDQCVVIREPVHAQELALTVAEIAHKASDMFLIYFAGHGLRDMDMNGDLYLATGHAVQKHPHFTALAYDDLRRAMLMSGARSKVVVLDCCFSGLAHGQMSGQAAAVAGQLDIKGTCVLTATKNNDLAKAPVGATYTAYTGELVDVLRNGVPDGPELLDIRTVHEQLVYRLRSAGLPEPRISGSDTIHQLSLAHNASRSPGVVTPVASRSSDAVLPVASRPSAAAARPRHPDPELDDLRNPILVYQRVRRLERDGGADAVVPLCQRAVRAGNTHAMLFMAAHHHDRGDQASAQQCFDAAAQLGMPNGMTRLAEFVRNRGDLTDAETWYRRAAAAGDPEAAEALQWFDRRQQRLGPTLIDKMSGGGAQPLTSGEVHRLLDSGAPREKAYAYSEVVRQLAYGTPAAQGIPPSTPPAPRREEMPGRTFWGTAASLAAGGLIAFVLMWFYHLAAVATADVGDNDLIGRYFGKATGCIVVGGLLVASSFIYLMLTQSGAVPRFRLLSVWFTGFIVGIGALLMFGLSFLPLAVTTLAAIATDGATRFVQSRLNGAR